MNGEHLSPKTRELLDKPIEERIAHIQKDSWIPYSQANKILQQLEDLLQHPKCDRMPNLAISAQTNNGKTRLMKHFLSLHQARETSSGTIAAPVFYVQSPSIPEESRLYSAILLKLCKKFRPSAPPQEKLVLVLDALSKIEIRILALDEVNFTEVGTAAKQKRFPQCASVSRQRASNLHRLSWHRGDDAGHSLGLLRGEPISANNPSAMANR
jgi:Bacterial TniB protein